VDQLARLLASDLRWKRVAAAGGVVSLQPTGGLVNGLIPADTFAAYAVDVHVPVTEVFEAKTVDESGISASLDVKTASSAGGVLEEQDDEESCFSEEEIAEIIAQYLTPEVLEQIPVTQLDVAGIHFVQYVCDFVREDLWEQRDMNESRWIGVVRALKRELYAYLERKAATLANEPPSRS